MTILAFQFEDKVREWKLERVKFAPFNLLVGMSGVGKTLILDSLRRVRNAGIRGPRLVPGCAWTMEIAVEGKLYSWSAETSRPSTSGSTISIFQVLEGSEDIDRGSEAVHFVEESITLEDGSVLFKRSGDELVLRGQPMPSLKKTESLISLLNEDDTVKPIFRAMHRFLTSDAQALTRGFVVFDKPGIARMESKLNTLDDLRDASSIPFMAKMFIMQNRFPDDFNKVVSQYREIFKQVEEVKVGKLSEFDVTVEGSVLPAEFITVALRERDVPRWLLVHHHISSGMIRTLMHLFELALAPAGTVVLIDEFENSLGVNCLSEVTEHLIERSGDLQFFITSHHPYIINNVPIRDWLVVTRHGCTVKVLDATQLPALNTKSHQDKFTLLTNLREYERGVA